MIEIIRNGTQYGNPEETKEGMASGSSKDALNSSILTEPGKTISRPCSTAQPKKE